MATWGYRVYTFKLLHYKEELSQESTSYRQLLFDALEMVGKRTRVGKPNSRLPETESSGIEKPHDQSEDEYETTKPTLNIRSNTLDSQAGVIHSHIAVGEMGLHDYAIDPIDEADRVFVKPRSAETPRRVDFYFASAGFEGFIVTEVLGTRDPIPLLVKWIRDVSLRHRRRKLNEIDKAYKTSAPRGSRPPKSAARASAPKTLSVKIERATDPHFLSQLLEQIKSMETEYIELDEHNNEVKKRLSINVKTRNTQKAIVDLFSKHPDGDSIIRQTLEELDMTQEELERANISPNHVRARVRGEEASTTLVPGKLSDLFTYSFRRSGRPGNPVYYRVTLGKMQRLKTPAQIPIKIPDVEIIADIVSRDEELWRVQNDKIDG